MAYQITNFVFDKADIAFVEQVFRDCGESVLWEYVTGKNKAGRTQYAIFRLDCHIEIRHIRQGCNNEPTLVED